MECYRSDENERRRRIVQLALEAYVLARSAVVGAAEVLIRDGESACAAVQAVEQRLDDLDRSMDEHVADAISNVGPQEARDLLACVKAMVDLERIGDLAQSFASRARTVRERIATEDINLLLKMCVALDVMLRDGAEAFATRNLHMALAIIRADAELDRLRNLVVFRHTEQFERDAQESFHVLALAQTLERAGDHAKNVAEEVCHMVSGQTVRHLVGQKGASLEQMYLEHLFERHAIRTGS
ncbi:MAG TPA: PhoU domain-containing protein [Terriglobales bacterium]|nr:PhoU domain-containing protein [Terriglobales bacterium]